MRSVVSVDVVIQVVVALLSFFWASFICSRFMQCVQFFLFLGACTFIIAYFIATANAPFGSSFYHGEPRRHNSSGCLRRRYPSCSWKRAGRGPRRQARLLVVGRCVFGGVRIGLLCSLAALLCLPAWFAALCLLSVVSALAGFIHLLVKGTLCWFVVCASRGHRFALGAGGLKQSLLVGGIGPVYSLPKCCFKPFRRLSAVGFVLGWRREPLFNNNPAGAVFHMLL